MILGAVTRLVLATDLSCVAGATVLGVLPVVRWQVTERIDGFLVTREATVVIPLAWASQSQVIARRVIRVYALDGSTADYDEYRIHRLVRNVAAGTLTISARGPEHDLREYGTLINNADYLTTPTSILTNRVDPALPSYWAVGTVTPSSTVDATYSQASPLSVALAVAEAVYNVSGSRYEVSVRRNGVTDYKVDLTAYNASATVADLRTRKNLLTASLTLDTDKLVTRLYATTPGGLAKPTYEISAISVNTYIDVIDRFGGPGPSRINDQWNGSYWFEWKTRVTGHQITDSERISATTTRLFMSSTTGMVVGDLGYFAKDSSDTDLDFVPAPDLEAIWGIKVGSFTGDEPEANLFNNPDARDFTTSPGAPDDWTSGNATKITTAGLWLSGGVSARISDSGGAGTVQYARDGGGAGDPNRHQIYCKAGERITYLVRYRLGSATNDLQIDVYNPNTGAADTTDLTGGEPDTWLTVSRSYVITTGGAKTVRAHALASAAGAGNFVYIDSIQVILGSSTSFRRQASAASNVAAANAYYDAVSTPTPTYEVDVADLYTADGTAWPYDALRVGANVYLTDETLGLTRTALRVMALERRSESPLNPRVTLASIPGNISRQLTSVSSASGTTTVVVGGTGGASSGQSAIQFEDEGSALGAAGTVDEVDFVGAGVSAARTGNKVTVTIGGGGGGGAPSEAAIAFTDGDVVRRVTVADAGVTGSSKIGDLSIRRPDTTDDAADKGYLYTANVVEVASGQFDVLVVCRDWGGDDTTDDPPNETITLYYRVG